MPARDLTRLLQLEDYEVQYIDEEYIESVTLFVAPTAALPVCSDCGQGCLFVHSTEERTIRHLDVFARRSFLRFKVRFVDCESCGVHAERIGFVDSHKRSSKAFRRYVGELCRILPNSHAAQRWGLSEDTVRSIDKEFIAANYPPPDLSAVRVLAVDEIAYRKGHKYLTVVLNYDTGEVLWTGEGRRASTLKKFFKLLGPKGCKRIIAVAMDMAAPYIKAVREACKNARIVFDRFHVVKHLNEALNDTRKLVMAQASTEEKRAVKGQRFILLRRRDNLSEEQGQRLDELLAINTELTSAYLLKEDFVRFWACRSPAGSANFLDRWVREALATECPPIMKVARMLKRHRDGLIAFHSYPISNGPLEGLNTKINVLRRSRYGFRDLEYFGLKIRQASLDWAVFPTLYTSLAAA